MQKAMKRENRPSLDQSKLLGFRNLAPVTPADKDIRKSSEIAFNKIGLNGETPA